MKHYFIDSENIPTLSNLNRFICDQEYFPQPVYGYMNDTEIFDFQRIQLLSYYYFYFLNGY